MVEKEKDVGENEYRNGKPVRWGPPERKHDIANIQSDQQTQEEGVNQVEYFPFFHDIILVLGS